MTVQNNRFSLTVSRGNGRTFVTIRGQSGEARYVFGSGLFPGGGRGPEGGMNTVRVDFTTPMPVPVSGFEGRASFHNRGVGRYPLTITAGGHPLTIMMPPTALGLLPEEESRLTLVR